MAKQRTFDPTKNVIALSKASARRQDDLREGLREYIDSQISHMRDTDRIRSQFYKEIRDLETSRLNAVRAIDVAAVKTEADRVLNAVQVLATTTAATLVGVNDRIAALQKSSYEGAGKQGVTDPMLVDFGQKLERTLSLIQENQGQKTGVKSSMSVVAMAISGLFGLAGIVSFILTIASNSHK